MNKYLKICFLIAALCMAATVRAETLPASIAQKMPNGYAVWVFASSDFNNDKMVDYVVVAHKENEEEMKDDAPRRPLLVFLQNQNGTFTLAARNDWVVMAVDEGGQCDPFEDGMDGLAVKGAYFTVQNSVACGQHWTDFMTFKYSAEQRNFVFHKRISESWEMNNSTDPNADALVPGPRQVKSADKKHPVLLQDYKPNP
jgi:hypothetical protein